jgi:myo-inositol-1(or 4)-monophosphatase
MAEPARVLAIDWLAACRKAATGLRAMLADTPFGARRVAETGRTGEGGDRTLIIDAAAEQLIFDELELLYEAGARFTVVSEERGTVDYGDDGLLVVVDPIDGSLNAKRGMGHHALSIAVADGPTMADVFFGYVFDFGPGEEWYATRGGGAYLDDVLITDAPAERQTADGRLELVAVESADPRYLAQSSDALVEHVHRIRAMGSIAIALCQVALTRVDGMATLWRSRAVDAAAAQLIVREAGGLVAFPAFEDPLGAPLDLLPHSPVVAGRTPQTLARLATLSTFQQPR